jgi:aromatic-L-amino-acid decarboxylase
MARILASMARRFQCSRGSAAVGWPTGGRDLDATPGYPRRVTADDRTADIARETGPGDIAAARPALDPAQETGLLDMDPEAFRAAAHEIVDAMADYLAHVEQYPVYPAIEPGSIAPLFPGTAPEDPEPLSSVLADYRRLIEPNATHWQHPGFMAYFATTASGPGILGEMLTAALAQNPMVWRTSPIGTELEEVVVGWLRRGLGLPDDFDGLITDTASTSSLISLAAAREAAGFGVSAGGLAGRGEVPGLRVYASPEAHSSIDKALMTLGLGRTSLVHVAVDDAYAMRVQELQAAIARDRAAGLRPIAVVAVIGTTSSTAIDPVGAIADIAAREGLWLHVDAAYAGAGALLTERRDLFAGWERADSIVVNPHKWLFTPMDASLLLTRRMTDLRATFSLVPEYLRTRDRVAPVRDYSEYTPQLGRRFRALKLWIELRWFGLEGLRRRLRHHLEMAQAFSGWIDADPDWQRLAPVPFSTVCFRWRPRDLAGQSEEADVHRSLEEANGRILDAVNRSGEAFLSHTRLDDVFTIRLSVGNLRTEARHVERTWDLLRAAAAAEAERR